MNRPLIDHVLNYEEIYQFIAKQPRSEGELTEFMMQELKKKDSTVRTFIREIKKGGAGLFQMDGELIAINKVKAQVLVDEILNALSLPRDDETISKIAEQSNILEKENAKQDKTIADLKKAKSKLEKQLKETKQALKDAIGASPKFVYQSLNQKVLVTGSIRVGPKEKVEDGVFLEDVEVVVDIDEPIMNSGGERDSFYNEIQVDECKEPSKEFTEANFKKKSILRVVTDRLLRRSVVENNILKLEDNTEHEITLVDERREKSDKELLLERFKRSQKKVIQNIADNKRMTNQEKLAMYAFYSDYHGKDMEKLINFAGDNGIHANLLIQLLEDPGKACSFENVRDMLRQFAKASEFRIREDFANELIAGEWYITADYNGHITKFQLVPIEEFNELRTAVGLPASTFHYHGEKQPVEIKVDEKKQEEMNLDDKVKRFNCLEDAVEESPEMPEPEN